MQKRCKAVNLMKEKTSGEIKGGTCINGGKQRGYIKKEDAVSPTVLTESVSLTAAMEAKEGCKVCACDAPNAFAPTKLDDATERIILMLHGLAAELLCEMAPVHKPFLEKERGQSVLHLECTNVICGTLKAALLFLQSI